MANTHRSGSTFAEQAKDTASGAVDKGKDMASGAMEKGKEAASGIMEKAKDMGGAALSKAGDAASWVGQRAEDGVSAVGSGMKSLGETIRDKGPQGGIFGGAASAIGSGLESSGEYLERGMSGMAEDLGHVIRRNPVVSVLVAVGLGFVLARLTSSRS